MEEIIVPKGDYGIKLDFTMTDNDDAAINLSGYTVRIYLWRPSTPGTKVLDGGLCTIYEAANGTCYYTIQASDVFIATAKTYVGRLVAAATGKRESVKPVRVVITE